MARRLFVLLVPFVLVVAACSDDDPAGSGSASTPSSTSSTTEPTGTTEGPTTTQTGAPTSTTTPAGDGIALTGATGSGSFAYTLEAARSELCYRISVTGIGEATEADLHRTDGEVVLDLQPPAADGLVNTCSATDALLIEELDADPSRFYVEVRGARGALKATLE